jgi:hypothetical protein
MFSPLRFSPIATKASGSFSAFTPYEEEALASRPIMDVKWSGERV